MNANEYFFAVVLGESELTGATNLMNYYGLEHSYSKFSGKKVKEQLSSFLPSLPGDIREVRDVSELSSSVCYYKRCCWNVNIFLFPFQDNSSLRSIIEKPPIVGKELMPLTSVQLAGFRLHPGPLPEHYRYLNTAPARKHKNKHKKSKHKDGTTPQETSLMGECSWIVFIPGLVTTDPLHHNKMELQRLSLALCR